MDIIIIENFENFECVENSKNLLYVKNKYYAPIQNILNMLSSFCISNNYKNILEIGPGKIPFRLASHFIGYNEKVENYISVDIDKEKFPFEDKYFDFIYSRHTLEDIQNPDFAFDEIIRTSSSGYIETPSPLVEILKGIDSNYFNENYCGYIHHRYIIWSNIEKCEIYFLPKYSCIIDNLKYDDEMLKKMLNIVNNYPIYWNNYFIWKDRKPKIKMYKNGINFDLTFESYANLLNEAVNESIKNTNFLVKNYNVV